MGSISAFRSLCILASVAFLGVSPAAADPGALRAAIERNDLEALREAGASGAPEEQQLAEAVALAWRMDDAEAVPALEAAAAAQKATSLKAAALRELAAVHMRLGNFAASAQAGERANAVEPSSADFAQALTFVSALKDVPPTKAVGKPAGRVPIKRDLAGLPRADISIGGVTLGAILDTGANFSTINETAAARMKLRMLDAAVSVGSSSRDEVASRLGVADRITIGEAVFENVVFIVLPDADLSFANGAYTIDLILGMPVFLQMGQMDMSRANDGEWFTFGGALDFVLVGRSNILMAGLSPLVQGEVQTGETSTDLVLLLDTSAQQTSLESRLTADAPVLLEGAATVTSSRGGAGGVVVSDQTRRIPKLSLEFGGKSIELKDVDVHPDDREDRHGILGHDAFPNGLTIDWDAGIVRLN